MAQADSEKTYDVSADKYYQAVSEYEKYPTFVEGMKSVKAKRTGFDVIADYELSMMSKDMSYQLKIKEDPSAKVISWTLSKSDFFKVNNGKWTIQSTGPSSCKVHYSLEVDFNFTVPGFLLKGVVKSTLPTMMNSFYERAKKL